MGFDPELTPAGWPRTIHNGWPVPWVSPRDNLARMHGPRLFAVRKYRLCQVCGEKHAPDAPVYLVVNAEDNNLQSSQIQHTTLALTMDDSALHERCLRLAQARCPRLRALRESGHLRILKTTIKHVFEYAYDPNTKQLCALVRNCTILGDHLP